MLKLARDLSLPVEAVTEKLGFLGRTGSGKTYAAQKLAEEMHKSGVQFVVLDPVGVWYGLRLAADGKKPGLPVPVLGGLKGDIPLEPHAGALIANLVVDRGTSVIIDVSQFESDADKARFARDFAERFFFRKKASPSAVHVFLEECQEFVPQNPQREEARMLHAFTRLFKIGRNFGVGGSLISQRPQEVNKKVLNLTELLFCFQLTGPQERKVIEGWIAEKGIDEDIAGELPKLEVGHPHVWSPAWLKISKVISIGEKWTFDASSTPKVGKRAAVRELSPIDLKELAKEMTATIERAKAEDPRLLRQRIAELERAAKKPAMRVNVPTADKRTAALQKALEEAVKFIIEIEAKGFSKESKQPVRKGEIEKALADAAKSVEASIERHMERRGQELAALSRESHRMIKRLTSLLKDDVNVKIDVRHQQPFTVSPAVARSPRTNGDDRSSLPPGEHATLKAVLQYPGLERGRLSVLTGYKRSSRDAYIARLVQKGYVEAQGQNLHPTQAGQAAMPSFEPLPTGSALAAYWQQRLPEGERKTLDVILSGGMESIPREKIDNQTGYKRSSRDAYLARLKARGLVIFGSRGFVRASVELFD